MTETDVWLGTFEVWRTREWRDAEVSMADALAEKKKRLGKLHKWRIGHFASKMRHGSGSSLNAKKVVTQRDVVMAISWNWEHAFPYIPALVPGFPIYDLD
eukprot:COSAG02_NODE_37387_length_442_cov_1.314869_1_plen_100_part_00